MADRIGSISLNTRGAYYSLSQDDNLRLDSTRNLRTTSIHTTNNTLCLLAKARRIQQRYKLVIDGLVHVCRVPHAKNIIEKIRFSRFLRRWEEHYIQLAQNEILSQTVRILFLLSKKNKNKSIYIYSIY